MRLPQTRLFNMAFCTFHKIILCAVVFLVVFKIHFTEQATIVPRSEEENSSSAENNGVASPEYDEITSDRSDQQLHKRATDQSGQDFTVPRLNIPGLPDPAAILKIVQVLQTVSEQVLPIIVEGIRKPVERVTERLSRDFKLLKNLRNRLDVLGQAK